MVSRRDPFTEIEELIDRMTREFEGLGSETRSMAGGGINVDVAEDDDVITVTADLPGYDREDIDVTIRDQVLTLSAEHAESTEEEGTEGPSRRYHRRERRQRSVSRRVRLPVPVEEDEATATYRHGVLTVELPKESPDESDAHNIDIS